MARCISTGERNGTERKSASRYISAVIDTVYQPLSMLDVHGVRAVPRIERLTDAT